MELHDKIVCDYITYFFSRIVGFERQGAKYASISESGNEFLAIAMDKVDRLTRKRGKLRTRVWSNCYFIFHGNETEPSRVCKEKVAAVKKIYPFLFIRSYVYFVFVNTSRFNQASLLHNSNNEIDTSDYKIWAFNTKYEVKEEPRRTNLFGIALDESEVIDDYIYLANPESELSRMEAANSDAVDCVRAFTGDLELLEQTSEMLELVRQELKINPSARVLVEGPARSGKTIIAATLLGEYQDSKFLLMNYFFYQAIIDGFHALSGWSAKEIDALVRNPELDMFLSLKDAMPFRLKRIRDNLVYAIQECDKPRSKSQTKLWIMENISALVDGLERLGIEQSNFSVVKSLKNLNASLVRSSDEESFAHIDKSSLEKLHAVVDGILSGKYDDLKKLQATISSAIEELVMNSRQKFFHHNINKNISDKLKDGCWIERGSPTISKMWSAGFQPRLVICDEVQRLGHISAYGNYDEFDEVAQILAHSNQSFFTGDDFQMLNSKYDMGIERISNLIRENGESLARYKLPESVGVPAEIGLLMKCLTNPQSVELDEVVRNWKSERGFEVIFMERNADLLIALLDEDGSNKKHIASPMDYSWLAYEQVVQIDTRRRDRPITALKDHEKENFAYKFPYFCNEEIMPNYILSAYELISREVESLYVNIPKFGRRKPENDHWYRKHLYVLFTRPTVRLVVNFEVSSEFEQMKRIVAFIEEKGAHLPVTFIGSDGVKQS